MTRHELYVRKKLIESGFIVFKKGLPDFLCLRNGKIIFVEAKCGYDRLSDQQRKVHAALRAAGLPIFGSGLL